MKNVLFDMNPESYTKNFRGSCQICITLSFYLKINLCKKSFQNVYPNSKCFYSIYLLSIKSFNV